MSVRMGIRLRAWVAAAAVMILLLPAFVTPASASDRVALVIGNANYDHVPVLANPLNDASDIGAALDRLGFEVTRIENADQIALRRGLREFKLAASVSEMAVVFYAGHGIEVDNRNFLVPVDARLQSDDDVEFETVPLDLLSRAVDGAKRLGLIILDACRDNPFAVAMHRAGATRTIGRGLARVEPSGATLVAYAAKEGTIAADGEGRNSPYTTALLVHLEEPGLEVGLMFRKVRDAVLASTGGRQHPFVYGSISSEGAYLAARPQPAKLSATQASPAEDTGTHRVSGEREHLFWQSVKDSDDPADLEAYLDLYPNGIYEALARNRLRRLQAIPDRAEASVLVEDGAADGGLNSDRLAAERLAAEREFWASVKGSNDPADIQAYLDQYPGGQYEVLARNKLRRLGGSPKPEEAAVQAAGQQTEPPSTDEDGQASKPLAVVTARAQEPRSASVTSPLEPEAAEAMPILKRDERRNVQRGLASLGFNPGPADGLFGPRTRVAVGAWQEAKGFEASGRLTREQADALMALGRVQQGNETSREQGEREPEEFARRAEPETSITVKTVPTNARVRVFTETGSNYRDGMTLEPGRYEIAVDAPRHETFRQRLDVEGPTTYRVSLCGFESRTQNVCTDKPVTRTKSVRKSLEKWVEGSGSHTIRTIDSMEYKYVKASRAKSEVRRFARAFCEPAEESAKRSIERSCQELGGRVNRSSFRVKEEHCSLANGNRNLRIVGSMLCEDVIEVVEESYVEQVEDCHAVTEEVLVCPDEIVTRLR